MPPASNAFVPSACGLIMASYVVREFLKDIKIQRVSDDKKVMSLFSPKHIIALGFLYFLEGNSFRKNKVKLN